MKQRTQGEKGGRESKRGRKEMKGVERKGLRKEDNRKGVKGFEKKGRQGKRKRRQREMKDV